MKMRFQVLNVKCQGCANRIISALKPRFGDIFVNLSKEPREIELEIAPEQIPQLRQIMKQLGYPFVDESMNFVQKQSAKITSFVSCAIGRADLKTNLSNRNDDSE
jgi:copper chaperone CopZ